MAKSGIITYEMRKFIAENPHNLSGAAIARKFGVHHTTILYHQRIMELEGISVNRYSQRKHGKNVLEELKKELKK